MDLIVDRRMLFEGFALIWKVPRVVSNKVELGYREACYYSRRLPRCFLWPGIAQVCRPYRLINKLDCSTSPTKNSGSAGWSASTREQGPRGLYVLPSCTPIMHAASETPHYRGIDTSIKLKLNVLEMKELLILLCCGDCEMMTIQTMGYGSR